MKILGAKVRFFSIVLQKKAFFILPKVQQESEPIQYDGSARCVFQNIVSIRITIRYVLLWAATVGPPRASGRKDRPMHPSKDSRGSRNSRVQRQILR